MRKTHFLKLLSAAFVLTVPLSGCALVDAETQSEEQPFEERSVQQRQADDSVDEREAVSREEPADESAFEESEPDVYAIEEVLSRVTSTYVQRGSEYSELYKQNYNNVVHSREDDRFWCAADDVDFNVLEPEKGDQLITTIAVDEATCFPVVGSCFIGGNREFADSYLLDYKRNEGTEINGIPLVNVGESSLDLTSDQRLSAIHDEVQKILLPLGIEVLDLDHGIMAERYPMPTNTIFASEQPTSFTCGTYIGTDWTEEVVSIDIPCYIVQNKGFTEEFPGKAEIDLPVEKTKSGYFVIDYSELEPGRYECQVGRTKCLIEVA